MEFSQKQQQVFLKLADWCSRAEHCSFEALQKLSVLELEEAEAQQVLERLMQERFIDDERFANSYVRDKFRFNKWGRIKIRYMLRQMHIATAVVNKAFNQIDDDEYLEMLRTLIRHKQTQIKSSSPREKKANLLRFAQGRGFEPHLIFGVLGEPDEDG